MKDRWIVIPSLIVGGGIVALAIWLDHDAGLLVGAAIAGAGPGYVGIRNKLGAGGTESNK